ncbi:hypothetical protein [Parabacteroides sp. ZJ-118]|uniref:hypothetical protein n=1 Tax=Parabacteroides sp. ZJ-118 TaxID=2709398 RepID=UPI001F1554DF|nr:hypothetical protein [Parabacteroides sp. ZJ-118]
MPYYSIILLLFSGQILLAQNNRTFNAERRFQPDEALKEIKERERNKTVGSSVMSKEEMQKTGCRDLYCLQRKMSGIAFAGEYGVRGANGAIVIKTSR